MKWTDEQCAVLECNGDAKIHAVAGSGKTSTLIEYARRRTAGKRVLYIAFNRSVRIEAQRKFAEAGITNASIETAHSLAFRHIVPRFGYQIAQSQKPHEIVSILELKPSGRDPLVPLIVARHIARLTTWFCNSTAEKIADLDYRSIIHDEAALEFVNKHYDKIVLGARQLLAKMNSAAIPVTHEFYLKKFQLSAPVLNFDHILFDEGQDASPVMLDVFLRQHARKIIVGDIHQQIYSWRHAINALGEVGFREYPLTTSFRFAQPIADLAMQCLSWKKHLCDDAPFMKITGAGKSTKVKTRAILARTNLYLLRSAIRMVTQKSRSQRLYFEGNISSYTYAGEGASIYDVLALYTGESERIRDPMIKLVPSFDSLKEYAGESEDKELSMLIDMVEEYGKQLPYYLQMIKTSHVDDTQKDKADYIFSTVHRCKGLEYDSVQLEEDFITEKDVVKLSTKKELEQDEINRTLEEINLLYVAVTRTRKKITLPSDMEKLSPHDSKKLPKRELSTYNSYPKKTERTRYSSPSSYEPWDLDQEDRLRSLYERGRSLKQIAKELGRNTGAIRSRLRKLGIE